jgi:hypothetical protein
MPSTTSSTSVGGKLLTNHPLANLAMEAVLGHHKRPDGESDFPIMDSRKWLLSPRCGRWHGATHLVDNLTLTKDTNLTLTLDMETSMNTTDVTIHINQTISPDLQQKLETTMREIDGVIAPRFNLPHMLVVLYNAEKTSSEIMLNAVRNKGYQA